MPWARRCEIRWLDHDRVAERERRGDLPRRNRQREVPWRDEADDPDRLAPDLDVDAGPHGIKDVAVTTDRLAREVLECGAGPPRFADGIRQRLSHLPREDLS